MLNIYCVFTQSDGSFFALIFIPDLISIISINKFKKSKEKSLDFFMENKND
jgi:hypothetical protein